MSPYRYSPLLPGPDSIRLLRLIPHEDETAPIQCQLFNYSLQESGKGARYETLSYVWGDPGECPHIFIDEYRFDVRVNLHAALSRLRDCCAERIIWVDAICINQNNPEERGRQVQSMTKIYGKANRVIVWLGEAADNSDIALEEIRVAAGKRSANSSNNATIERPILELLQRPWFRRIWVREQTIDNIRRNY